MERSEMERAAVRAELETGHREASATEAKRHIAVRLARMGIGFVLLLAGGAMLVLPGPGALVIAAGLVLLAEDIVWADRALRFVRRRVPGVPEDGTIPRSTLLVGSLLTTAGVVASLWFALR